MMKWYLITDLKAKDAAIQNPECEHRPLAPAKQKLHQVCKIVMEREAEGINRESNALFS